MQLFALQVIKGSLVSKAAWDIFAWPVHVMNAFYIQSRAKQFFGYTVKSKSSLLSPSRSIHASEYINTYAIVTSSSAFLINFN